LTERLPKTILAGQRETGALCSCCGVEITPGISVTICHECGEVHHTPCWKQRKGCCSYQCSSSSISAASHSVTPLSITRDELAVAVPLPTQVEFRSFGNATFKEDTPRRWNRLSVWAFVLAILGIPLFGLITGMIAIILACIALVLHNQNNRGMGLAVAAMVIGLFDVIGWAGFLTMYWGSSHVAVSLADLPIDPTSLDGLTEPIARAMRANVLLQVNQGLGRGGIGSGVVLKISEGSAFIVTNRHVIDKDFSDATTTTPAELGALSEVIVMAFNQATVIGVIEWIAPYGIDLAIISAPVSKIDVVEAHWNTSLVPHIGDDVFAVGNPHGLGWTHTSGSLSQIRRQTRGVCNFKVLQTSAPINPGNSGGGLYDELGQLIGINTMTAEKKVAEGLGFSIALPILMELVPDRFDIHNQNPAVHQP